jgi:GT2 family glycosyltransferase
MISVVIPTCDEAVALRATIDSVAKNKTNKEVIIVDAGSVDGTSELAGENASRVLFSLRRQRAYQMNLGTQDAHGSILLFPARRYRAACFGLRTDGVSALTDRALLVSPKKLDQHQLKN